MTVAFAVALLLCTLPPGAPAVNAPAARRQEPRAAAAAGDEGEPARARAEADRKRRRGDARGARRELLELLDEDPADAESRALLARALWDEGQIDQAVTEARAAVAASGAAGATGGAQDDAVRALAARTAAEFALARGEASAAQELCDSTGLSAALTDPRNAWIVGRSRWESGARAPAREAWQRGADAPLDRSWEELLAKARCQRRLDRLSAASETLVHALDSAEAEQGEAEPALLVELGELYFEADGEVAHPQARRRSPAPLYDQALRLDPRNEAAQLALFALYRFNWMRQRRSAQELLGDLLRANPRSISGLIAAASADLDDGQLVSARERLAALKELAPARREVRALAAALAWIEHRDAEAEATLVDLARESPEDSAPERELGRHLSELYRFAEAHPFLERATVRDPGDWAAWTELGRALANSGREQEGLTALKKGVELAAGRQNAWRHNTILVLEKLQKDFKQERFGELSFAWSPEAALVLRVYYAPFYATAQSELAQRYGFTPPPTHIEVFPAWTDFSVRSTGFEGFPALGVCFGPVVTAVSPLSELRGTFSWARTAFHEFTHVIHLGLSHNRCPRWITEGIATWEEENKALHWTRNMRRELLDALANGELIRVREMNRAFRGPRILFGYFQSGLVVRMWVERYGFAPLVRLLEAFDQGADLDQALATVLHTTPEQVDADFERYVRARVEKLALEPRWSLATLSRLKLSLERKPPAPSESALRARWAEDTCTLAWAQWQAGQRVDAEEALRRLDQAAIERPRALFLRGEIAASRGETERAVELWRRGLELGGEDFRVRVALGKLALQDDERDAAEREFLAARADFPGYAERELSSELALAELYDGADDSERALRMRVEWLEWNDDLPTLMEVARWHAEAQRFAEAAGAFERANEVDPFRRALHEEWARALEGAGRIEAAVREYEVALLVPAELDADDQEPWNDARRAAALGRLALLLARLSRFEDAAARAAEALALDDDQEDALEALKLKP